MPVTCLVISYIKAGTLAGGDKVALPGRYIIIFYREILLISAFILPAEKKRFVMLV